MSLLCPGTARDPALLPTEAPVQVLRMEPLEEGIWQRSQKEAGGAVKKSRGTCTSRGPDQDARAELLRMQEHPSGCRNIPRDAHTTSPSPARQ